MRHKYAQLTDEQIVRLAQAGDRRAEHYLLRQYRPLVVKRTQAYYLSGADRDDLLQEGMIGLHKAIRDYQDGRGIQFRRFATMCVVRHVITAVRTATRQKHMPLSAYMTLNGTEEIEQPLEILDVSIGHDPNEELIHQDGLEWVKAMLEKHLSGFEWQVLTLYLKGQSYRDISAALEKNTKAIDNALARIKEKGRMLQLQVALT
ncbi:MAG: sigma-70 family RNA polymerase sigma factor [Candidatus Sericytochromatia bacterium]